MSGQHTPGRLRLFDTYADSEIRDDKEKLVAVVLAEKANSARRLVACWNACEGLTTEHLENIDMLGETLAGRFSAFRASERELMDTRDELLAVLKGFHAWADNQADAQSKGGHATFDLWMLREQRDLASAAIEKAEGGAS